MPSPTSPASTRPLARPEQGWDIHRDVSKTSVEIDRDIAERAAEILGTRTLRETIDAALREIVHQRLRRQVLETLGEPGRFDLEAAEDAWGGDE